MIGTPEYYHTNFTKYFTEYFWTDRKFSNVFFDRNPCYFNTGVMVIDLSKWMRFGYSSHIDRWMDIQKSDIQKSSPSRIYELGLLSTVFELERRLETRTFRSGRRRHSSAAAEAVSRTHGELVKIFASRGIVSIWENGNHEMAKWVLHFCRSASVTYG
ncbi:Hexosyltransferase [Forsythia ovata]|uniref:Hexosyltransferase n=1 Tax=Forsythia ovata TaxID=205694 RepID=A0ABD1WSA7_9LAMI